MRVSIREHVIVADHENHVWKLVRDFFQPNDPRTFKRSNPDNRNRN